MAQYDDDYDDDDLDDDQDVDFDQVEDESDYGDDVPDTSTNEGLIQSICQMLNEKFHLELPGDCDEKTLFRDLHVALHAHPGIELIDDQGGMDYGDALQEEPEEAEEQLGYDQSGPGYRGPGTKYMPSNRRKPARRMSAAQRLTPKGQRISEERGNRVIAELTNNMQLSEAETARVHTAQRLSHGRQGITPTRSRECVEEIVRNAGLD